jgi:hypothetical protein
MQYFANDLSKVSAEKGGIACRHMGILRLSFAYLSPESCAFCHFCYVSVNLRTKIVSLAMNKLEHGHSYSFHFLKPIVSGKNCSDNVTDNMLPVTIKIKVTV